MFQNMSAFRHLVATAFVMGVFLLCATSSSSPSAVMMVEAASPPCNCYFGKVVYASPRCVCKCNAEYVAPWCQFKGSDIVRVEVWFNIDVWEFISDKVLANLKTHLGTHVNATLIPSIKFLYNVPSAANNRTMAIFEMPGMAANWLYELTWNQPTQWPRTQMQITGVFLTEEREAADPFLTNLLRTTYLYDDGLVSVALGDVIWMIGLLLFCIAVVVMEYMYLSNTEENAPPAMPSKKYKK